MLIGKRWTADGIAQVCICGVHRAESGRSGACSKRKHLPREKLEGDKRLFSSAEGVWLTDWL